MSRVLLVVTRAGIGGAQRSVLELARELTARGHVVTVAAGESGWLMDEVTRLGCKTHQFEKLQRTSSPFAAIGFMLEMRAFLKANPHEVVHLNSSNALPGAKAAKSHGAHVIFTARGLSMLDEGYEIGAALRGLYWTWFKLWFAFVDVIVCVSTRNAERLAKLHLAGSKVVVIPNGLNPANLTFMERSAARARLGANDTDVVVLSLGRLEYAKRQELLIRAWAQVISSQPHAKLVLVGDGPDEDVLKSLAKKENLGDRIHFAGAIPLASQLIPGADLIALPSRYEGWPVALLEALFAGVPIVSSDVGGVREQIGDAGIILPQDASPAMWAEAVTKLVGDVSLRGELGAKAKERSAMWTAAKMIGAYEKGYGK